MKKIFKNNSKSNLVKLGSLVLVGTICTGGLSQAAVTTFGINQTFTQGGSFADIGSTISLGGAGSFELDPGTAGNFFDFDFTGTGQFGSTGAATNSGNYNTMASFSSGDVISSGTLTLGSLDWDNILDNSIGEGDFSVTHDGFLGFIADGGEYGFIEYCYEFDVNIATIELKNGAFESIAGQSITVQSVIPEPSSTMLLGLGGLALLLRRKK